MERMMRNQCAVRMGPNRWQFFLGIIASGLLVAAGCSSDSKDGRKDVSENTQATEATDGSATTSGAVVESGTLGTASPSAGTAGSIASTGGSVATSLSGTSGAAAGTEGAAGSPVPESTDTRELREDGGQSSGQSEVGEPLDVSDQGDGGELSKDGGQDDGGIPEPEDYSQYHDPGIGPFEQGTPEQCNIDPSKFDDGAIGAYAVFRYGLLCHMKGGDNAADMWSATKTLGGVAVGRSAYLARDVSKTGPGTGPILHEDIGIDWISDPTYSNRDATISHIMAMVANASPSLQDDQLTFVYDGLGWNAINTMMEATTKCAGQVAGMPTDFAGFVQQEVFDKMGMTGSSYSPALGIAAGWRAKLTDMGKLGVMLVHDGWYGGEQFISPQWVYRMSHPAFESANTAYGQLAWLNHRGNAEGMSGDISNGPGSELGDPCAPAAVWPYYPHTLSEATSCLAEVGTCDQEYDVGVFAAVGMFGQLLVMHPGLDLVLVAQNFTTVNGQQLLWDAVRPGLVAMDSVYQGDEAAFCEAYGGGSYAPDLLLPRHP